MSSELTRHQGRCPGAAAARVRRDLGQVALLLALVVGSACATTPVEQGRDQPREGVLAADVGYWEEAEFRWRKALAQAPLNARALNNLAVRFEREGDFEEAKAYYDQALIAAAPAEQFYIERNYRQFTPIWERIGSGSMESTASVDLPVEDFPVGEDPSVGVLEIIVSVPDQGPNLAGFDRLLIGNFATRPGTESDINEFAVRYFRRRITQRTFFETQDQLDQQMQIRELGPNPFQDADYWISHADQAGADLVLTGSLGLTTEEESQMLRERIRSPDGQIREVARFQDVVTYKVTYDLVVIRGEDGQILLEETIESSTSFPVEDGASNAEAVFETLEQMLPQLLETITPRRSEQSRYLIY